jgi:O-antigen ligase
VTPTHLLAGVCIGVAVHLWISKKVSPKTLFLLIVPSILIAGLASTRLIAVFIILPILFAVFIRQNRANRTRLLWLISFIAISPALLTLLSQTVLPQIEIVATYLDNFVARITTGLFASNASAVDASSFYREQETFFASQFVAANPFFGGGFSSTYMNYPLISDTSFLGLRGNAYVHNTFLWILVKTGFVGLILFSLGIAKVVRTTKQSTYQYESHLFLSLLACLFIVAFVWNMLANSPDSIAFAGILGLFLASRNSKELIPLLTSVTEDSEVKR